MSAPARSATAEHAARLHAISARLEQRCTELERRRDARCVFTHAYTLMTRSIERELPLHAADDPEWVVTLAERFAALYFLALDQWDARAPLGLAWTKVFTTLHGRRTSVFEDLVFMLTAHIVHDLPLALVDVGLADERGRSHIRDFHAVNATMGDTIDEIQTSVAKRYAPYVRWLDHIGHGYDEILTDYGARMSRGLAWYNAERLSDPGSAADAARAIEKSPCIVVDTVMNPGPWSLRILLRGLRLLARVFRRWPAAPA